MRRGTDLEVRATTWTARGGRLTDLPPGVRQVGPRVPARLLREAWRRADLPPIEALVGRTDVVHGTNFTCPPALRARQVVTVHDLTYLDHAGTVSADSLLYRELVPRALARGAHVADPDRGRRGGRAGPLRPAGPAGHGHPARGGRRVVRGRRPPPTGSPPAGCRRRTCCSSGRSTRARTCARCSPRTTCCGPTAARSGAGRAPGRPVPDLVLAGPAGREESLAGRPGVHLTGWLDDDDLRRLVAGAACLVLPSLDEGFGLPVLEALACGRPVVVSDVPALREVGGPHVVVAAGPGPEALADAVRPRSRAPTTTPPARPGARGPGGSPGRSAPTGPSTRTSPDDGRRDGTHGRRHRRHRHLRGRRPRARCLAGLRRQDLGGRTMDVVVVDNASTDGTADLVERNHPRCGSSRRAPTAGSPAEQPRTARGGQTVRDPAQQRRGPGAGVRGRAGRRAGARARRRRRPDRDRAAGGPLPARPPGDPAEARVAGPDGPWVADPDGPVRLVNSTATRAHRRLRGRPRLARGRVAAPARARGLRVLRRGGGAADVRLRDVGLFDEDFFLYYEDSDLSWRLRLAGHRVGHCPEAVVEHVHARRPARAAALPLPRRPEPAVMLTKDARRRSRPARCFGTG